MTYIFRREQDGDIIVSDRFLRKDPFYVASLLGDELDNLQRWQDCDCAICGSVKGQHTGDCLVVYLLHIRKRMVPMVIN